MGIGADSQAASAVSADDSPVVVAALGIDLPAQNPVAELAITIRNGLAGAIVGAFFADPAEVQNAWFSTIGIGYQGHLSGYHANPDPGSLLGCD